MPTATSFARSLKEKYYLPERARMTLRHLLIVVLTSLVIARYAIAQTESPANPEPQAEATSSDTAPTMFSHSETSRFFVGGQLNLIFQALPPFHAKYSGTNSLTNHGDHALSRVATLYLGLRVLTNTEFLFDVEETGGRGIGDALGLAGFTNLDVVRNPDLGSAPYIARAMLHQVFGLTHKSSKADRNFLSLAPSLPDKRLEFRLGKFGVADFFDVNEVGSDSHLQFTNWTIDNNGAYDYAADTRGYTYGAILEYQSPSLGIRFGEALMPKVANGTDLDFDLRRARSENVELEFRPRFFSGKKTAIKPLAYLNHGNMGSYRAAINAFRSGQEAVPDVTLHRRQGTLKQGFGINLEQELPYSARFYLRVGWNEGKHESFAYTEVNGTLSLGADISGARWQRTLDRFGLSAVSNGLSRDHREYLESGGSGFLLGDGALSYARENILESYYTAHLWRGIYAAALLQLIANPGYNRDRGPVIVPGTRLHVEF
jgi:high affinity Mn2+ porin